MRKYISATLALVVVAFATSAVARSSSILTPAEIDQAIAAGTKAKGGLRGLSLVDSGQQWANALIAPQQTSTEGFSLRIYTPLTWVEQRASDAAKRYLPFSAAELTDEDLAPVLRVVVYPDKPTRLNGEGMALAKNADHVVLRDQKKRMVVQPLIVTAFTEQLSSALRDKAMVGVTATFDLQQLENLRQENKEFLVVVVGDHGERTFKIKEKHFDRLPYRLPAATISTK